MKSAAQFRLEPKKFRLFFAGTFLALLGLIWSVYASGVYFLERGAQSGLQERLRSDSRILEDHMSRTLDAVASRLRSLAVFSTPANISNARSLGDSLYELVQEDRVVRSISLVDARGRIIASSNSRNTGQAVSSGEIPSMQSAASSQVFFGRAYPFRDLADIASDVPMNSDLSFWMASIPVEIAGRTYHWVAAVNLGIFQNLWQQVDEDPATEIAIYSYAGERIAAHHGYVTQNLKLGKEIVSQASKADMGLFQANTSPAGDQAVAEGGGPKLLLAFRASAAHPAIMTVTADLDLVSQGFNADRDQLALYALLATLLICGLFLLAYRWYLRYEQSVVEMQNQATALDAHVMVSESNPEGTIISANPLFVRTTGYELTEMTGQNHRMFNSGLHPRRYYNDMWKMITEGQVWRGTFRNRKKTGDLYWVRTTIIPFKDAWGKVSRFVALYTDITDAIQAMDEVDYERRLRQRLSQDNIKLLNEANTDPLTRLANRRGFDIFVQNLTKAALTDDQPATSLAVMMLDLDRFKAINDGYGHHAGDQVLAECAARWGRQIRLSDLIARIGGEEFCVLLPGASLSDARKIAEKIRIATCEQPIGVDGEGGPLGLSVSVSVGLVVTGRIKEGSVAAMMTKADELLYQAKSEGRNRVVAEQVRNP